MSLARQWAFAGADGTSTAIGIGVIPSGPGTYPIGQTQPTNSSVTTGAVGSWTASSGQGSGSVTITAFTQTSARGTFEFTGTAVPNTGASGTKVVTQGQFDVQF